MLLRLPKSWCKLLILLQNIYTKWTKLTWKKMCKAWKNVKYVCVSHTIIWNIQLYDMENHSHTSNEFNPSKKATKKKKQRKIPPLDLPMCQQLWWLDAGHHRSTCDHRTTRIFGPPNWGYPRPTYSGVREGLVLGKMKRWLFHWHVSGWGRGPQCINVIKLMSWW